MTVLVSDSFNRANDATTLGITDSYAGGTAQTWTVVSGATYGISSNQAYITTATNDHPAYVNASASDVKVSVDLAVTSGIYNTGIVFRLQNNTNYFRCYGTQSAIKIDRCVNGAYTNILNQTLSGVTVPFTLTVQGSGSSISLLINGVQQGATITDTNFQTATNHGLYLSGTAQRLDNFQVEDLSAGGTNTSITSVIANANASSIVPSIYTSSSVSASITGTVATSTAAALSPQVGSFTNVTVNAVTANATASAINPSAATTRSINMITSVSNAVASFLTPSAGPLSVQINAVTASLMANATNPAVSIKNVVMGVLTLHGKPSTNIRLKGSSNSIIHLKGGL